jgi:WD40 repeat protein
VAEALEPFTAGHNLPALLTADTQRLTPVRPTPAPRRRLVHKNVTAVVLVAALLVVIAGGLALWSFLGTSPKETMAQAPTSPATPPTPPGPVTLRPSRPPLTQHSGTVLTLAFSPDGRVLASGGDDRTILLWDTETWKPRSSLEGHPGDVYGVAFRRTARDWRR